ncbi:unnamed protein product, partial [Prorocentrum cordatum]
MDITGKELPIESETFQLKSLIAAQLNDYGDEIVDICESADKQLIIEQKLKDVTAIWDEMSSWRFWKAREYPCVLDSAKVAEPSAARGTMMNLNTMNAQRHSQPFKDRSSRRCCCSSPTPATRSRGGSRYSRCGCPWSPFSRGVTLPSRCPWRRRSSPRSTRT